MRVIVSALFISFLTACASTGGPSTATNTQGLVFDRPESVDMSSQRLLRMDEVIQNYIDQGELAGAVSMVARDGKVVHFEDLGTLNLETGQELTRNSIFRIYSMSKPITTVAAMMLYEEGHFQLTDPVSDYLPEFKNILVLNEDGNLEKQKKPFTIRMLMTHTAGLTYGVFGNTAVDKKYRQAGILQSKDLESMVTKLGDIPLQFQPGTRWHYSVSVDVLGRLVEVISGQPLDEYLDEHLFTPLGMDDTFFQVPEDKMDRFGTNHRFNPETGELEVSDNPETSQYAEEVTFFSGGGGLLSTAADYMKFCQMMLNGGELNGTRILSRKTVDYMTTNHLDGIVATRSGESAEARPGSGFGLGFAVIADPTQAGVISSEGEYYWGGAAGTIFWIDPVEDLIAIIMIQHMNVQVPLRNTMKAVIYGAIEE